MQTLNSLPQRIAVVGTSGSGKTTLAGQISRTLGVPHVEIDALYWGPNWTPVDKALFRERANNELSAEQWVTCGNYFNTLKDICLARADTLAWLDYPFPLVFTRIVRRTARRLIAKESLWANNQEQLRKTLSRDSIILWACQTHWKNRRRYLALGDDPAYAHLAIQRLHSPKETDRFVQSLAQLAEESLQKKPREPSRR